MLPRNVEKYIRSRALNGDRRLEGNGQKGFRGAVVIPALAESKNLPATLASLGKNPESYLQRHLVILVVNHRADTCPREKQDNLETLSLLTSGQGLPKGIKLAWVDAATAGSELPPKTGGVGMARKIGFDLALERLDFEGPAPILASLDADTLVDPNYLETLERHFNGKQGGAVLPFRHRRADCKAAQEAIDLYELYMRCHALGLALAGSPYAFHTLGSALACTANAYVRAGGMNLRQAGEDFYFLQQLTKTSGVSRLEGTTVRPSPRTSARTPFGTGQTLTDHLAGNKNAILFYPAETYRILADWLSLVSQRLEAQGDALLMEAERVSPHLCNFLDSCEFVSQWEKLKSNNKTPENLMKAFHDWFDALKTVRLIHYLCDGPFPKTSAAEVLPNLLAWAKLSPNTAVAHQVQLISDSR